MEDADLEEIRRRKMAELQQQRMQQEMAEEQAQQIDAQRQAIMRKIMTPEARDRLATVKMAYPETADMVEDQLIRLASSGRLKGMVTDDMLRQILRQMTPQRRDITIERK